MVRVRMYNHLYGNFFTTNIGGNLTVNNTLDQNFVNLANRINVLANVNKELKAKVAALERNSISMDTLMYSMKSTIYYNIIGINYKDIELKYIEFLTFTTDEINLIMKSNKYPSMKYML